MSYVNAVRHPLRQDKEIEGFDILLVEKLQPLYKEFLWSPPAKFELVNDIRIALRNVAINTVATERSRREIRAEFEAVLLGPVTASLGDKSAIAEELAMRWQKCWDAYHGIKLEKVSNPGVN